MLSVEDCTVMFNGRPALTLNPRLIAKQGLDMSQVNHIKALHMSQLALLENLENNFVDPRVAGMEWSNIQFNLQKAWGFNENSNFHRFWELPKCTCPKMDNEDRFPMGPYIHDAACPIHGN